MVCVTRVAHLPNTHPIHASHNNTEQLKRPLKDELLKTPPDETYIWADEHADINLITALPRATAPGLQVRVNGEWQDVAPPPGHAIINTGIMLEHLTNGMIPSGWHRVVADPTHNGDRTSVVQFFHPRPSTILTPLPSTVDADRPCRYEAVSASDRLAEVIWEINLITQ